MLQNGTDRLQRLIDDAPLFVGDASELDERMIPETRTLNDAAGVCSETVRPTAEE